jgi:hypothetical protein
LVVEVLLMLVQVRPKIKVKMPRNHTLRALKSILEIPPLPMPTLVIMSTGSGSSLFPRSNLVRSMAMVVLKRDCLLSRLSLAMDPLQCRKVMLMLTLTLIPTRNLTLTLMLMPTSMPTRLSCLCQVWALDVHRERRRHGHYHLHLGRHCVNASRGRNVKLACGVTILAAVSVPQMTSL